MAGCVSTTKAPIRELREARALIGKDQGFVERVQIVVSAKRIVTSIASDNSSADIVSYAMAAEGLQFIPDDGFAKADCDEIQSSIRANGDPLKRGMAYPTQQVLEIVRAACAAERP